MYNNIIFHDIIILICTKYILHMYQLFILLYYNNNQTYDESTLYLTKLFKREGSFAKIYSLDDK